MCIDIYGSGNFQIGAVTPEELISDALSQNILWQAYERPLGVEELIEVRGSGVLHRGQPFEPEKAERR